MSNIRKFFNDEELKNGTTWTRLAICFCIDTGSSMDEKSIEEINAGLSSFYKAIQSDDTLNSVADIAIVTFGNDGVKCTQNFTQVCEVSEPPLIIIERGEEKAQIGEAVNLSLDLLDERKKYYQKIAYEYYTPWLILMSGGHNINNGEIFEKASSRCSDMVQNKKLVVFPIGVGEKASKETLSKFSSEIPPRRLKYMKFNEFFKWLFYEPVEPVEPVFTHLPLYLNIAEWGRFD